MKEKKTIEIDAELCNEIERLHYEYKALENVLSSYVDQHMLDAEGLPSGSPVFESFSRRLVDALMAYERKKSEMVDRYGLGNSSWNLNFVNHEVEVY